MTLQGSSSSLALRLTPALDWNGTIVDDGARALEATRRTFDGLGAPCSLPVNLSSFREFSPCR